MQKSFKKISCLVVAGLFLMLPALALAQSVSPLAQKYYDGVFSKPKAYDPQKYTAGLDEQRYYQGLDSNYSAMQLKYADVTDVVLEEFIATIAQGPYNTANPAGWLVAVHYPTNTGNEAVDQALKAQGEKYFAMYLPQNPALAYPLNIAKAQDADNSEVYNYGDLILNLSYMIKKAKGYQGEHYVYPTEKDGPIFPFITTYQITKPSAKYLSVIFTAWEFPGGAHDMWSANVMTFDLTTGRELNLRDLITDADLVKLQARFEALDKAQRGDDNFITSSSDGKYPALAMNGLALTPDGLMMIFNPYDIGSFSEGTIVYQIDQKDLAELGVNTKYWD